jgi:MFS transporter, FSR family, fosmidomycin resistance protein
LSSLLRNRTLLILCLGHFVTDFYASFMPLVWPVLSGPLGMSYGMIGFASTIYTAASSVTQPVFGYLGDRFDSRLLAALGVSITAILMGLIGFVDSYAALVALVVVLGLGVSAFHPQGAMNALIASGRNKASGMSIFTMGGTFAYAIGPLVAGWLFSTAIGVRGTAFLVIPGLLAAVWLYRSMVAMDAHKAATAGARSEAAHAHINVVAFLALVLVVGLRAWTFTATITYLPLVFQAMNLPLIHSGEVLFLMESGGVAGLLVGGLAADRFGRRRVTALALLLWAPVVYLLFQNPLGLGPLIGIVFGFLGEAPLPITTVMGQELLPRHVGLSSGIIYGLAFVTGGVGVALTGVLADTWGLVPVLNLLAVLPLLGALLCRLLPGAQGSRAAA